ncbi:MAG TPA: hypothetical protein VLS89_16540, partial [Candidatus Nanopelagicales bacterium]|nr:hypothetical protein [Candidatus Nanopelagicales bacterium]
EVAFRAAHHDAPRVLIGGWKTTRVAPGKILVESNTLYPCHLEEGTIAGICDAFAAERPTARLVEDVLPRRSGGAATCIEITYRPRDDAYQTAPASSQGPCRTHSSDTAP